MYFDDYINHPDAKINPALFWEYDMSEFDYEDMIQIVIERVIERGWPEDWYAILNKYGEAKIIDTIKLIPYLNDKDMNFVSKVFEIPLTEMRCYTRKQSRQEHWNS